MLLDGVSPKWRRTDTSGVTEFAFDWQPHGASEPLHWRSRSRDHIPILRLFVNNVKALRRVAPEAYVLTNARAGYAPAFNVGSFVGPVSLANHPNEQVKFDYFYDFLPRSDRATHLVELGPEDLSLVSDQLLGLVPDPEYWALLLAKESGLCSWVAEIPTQEGQAKIWEAKLLERFVVLITVHEGQFLIIRTRDPQLRDSLA